MRRPTRPRLPALLVAPACLALVLPAAPSAAHCEHALVLCGADHDETGAELVHLRQLSAIVDLRASADGGPLELYRALLPEAYEVPAVPQVAVSFAALGPPSAAPAPAAGLASVRHEGTIALRAVLDGRPAWYPLSRFSTDAPVAAAERRQGLPTHSAAASMTQTGTTWSGTATVDAAASMSLSWTPDRTASLGAGAPGWAQAQDPLVGLSPPLEGPQRTRVQDSWKPPTPVFDAYGNQPPNSALGVDGANRLSPLQRGRVRLLLDPDLNRLDADSPAPLPDLPFGQGRSLADLIEVDQTVPGLLWATDAWRVRQADNLDDGRDGPLPVAPPALPPAHGVVAALPSSTATGYGPSVVILPQGSSLTFTNLDTGAHDLVAVDVGPDGKPLFGSRYVGPPDAGTVTGAPVVGVEQLPRGRYPFYCSLHGTMGGAPGQLLIT